MKKVTLQTMADAIGVSKVAVYKALNNQKGVSEELRKKIQEYARAVGYKTKVVQREVKNKKFLFFVNQDFFLTLSEQYYSTIFYFLSAECNKTNNVLQIAFLESENTLEKIKYAISSYRPDGIFFAGEVKKEIMEYIQKISIATVFIDYYTPLYDLNFVYVDNFHLSYQLTKYLIDKGHRQIGFVGNISKTSAVADRFLGYQKALIENNIPINHDWHINANIEKSNDVVDLNLKEYPTAFVCHCDAAARWIYTALAVKGKKVPEDVSVISFDNTPLCETLFPKLTSAGPKKDYYAKKSFQAMISCLSIGVKLQQIRISVELMERNSIQCR